ncbi:MAG: hypothetical protein ABIR68_19165 [Ilumatobacteraceae bacterium]
MTNTSGTSGAPASADHQPRGGSSRSAAEASADHQHWFEPVAEHLGGAYLR